MLEAFNTQPAKLLIIGADSQIGHFLSLAAEKDPFYDQVPLTDAELDTSDRSRLQQVLDQVQPEYVINTSGYNDVDQAERDPDACYRQNTAAVKTLAEVCAERNISVVHLSSDYVFDGHYASGYAEDDDATPLGVYGDSKWQGEEALRNALERHLILRVSWVFSPVGDNYMQRTLRQAREQAVISAADDRRGCPTSAADIARVIIAMLKQVHNGADAWGTYHYCGAEVTSRYGFSEAVLAAAGQFEEFQAQEIRAVPSKEYGTDTERPASSVLVCKKLLNAFGIRQIPWRHELINVVQTLYQPVEQETQV